MKKTRFDAHFLGSGLAYFASPPAPVEPPVPEPLGLESLGGMLDPELLPGVVVLLG